MEMEGEDGGGGGICGGGLPMTSLLAAAVLSLVSAGADFGVSWDCLSVSAMVLVGENLRDVERFSQRSSQ